MLQAVCTAENPGCWVTKWLDLRISIQTMVWTVATVEWTEETSGVWWEIWTKTCRPQHPHAAKTETRRI